MGQFLPPEHGRSARDVSAICLACEIGRALMFTSGPADGEAVGVCCEEPLYHASLAPAEYERLLATNGFVVRAYAAQDPQCGGHTVWLATYDAATRGLTMQ